jgi:hypothetical protein
LDYTWRGLMNSTKLSDDFKKKKEFCEKLLLEKVENMITGNIDGKEIRVDIIESKNRVSFEKKINETIVNGGKPLFETFNVTNVKGISIKGTETTIEKYYILVAYEPK